MKKTLLAIIFLAAASAPALAANPPPPMPQRILLIDRQAILRFSKVGQDVAHQVEAYGNQAKGEIAGPGSNIKDERSGRCQRGDRFATPGAVQSESHHPIHQVVTRHDPSEHRLDAFGFAATRDTGRDNDPGRHHRDAEGSGGECPPEDGAIKKVQTSKTMCETISAGRRR